MNRKEFMMRLERLLKDIPQEERIEALAYYNGYFEDAGEENEEKIIMELESPEKVAKIIKADVGAAESGESMEYTEAGYQDRRFTDQQEVGARKAESRGSDGKDSSYHTVNDVDNQNKTLKIVLLVIVGIITSPIWLGLLGGAVGVIFGVLGVIFGVLVAVAAVVFALYVVGVVMVGVGVSILFAGGLAIGLGISGSGLLVLALAVLGTIACGWLYGKFLPWIVKGLVALCSKPFQKRGRMA